MNFGRSLAPFRHRRFALLWCGAFVSNIGTWMETVGGHPGHVDHRQGRLDTWRGGRIRAAGGARAGQGRWPTGCLAARCC
jgi:hypothetical protein